MTATTTAPHWSDEVDVDGLHEPTVRAIIDTMKRTGAAFGARVLEAQYRNGQVENTMNERAQALRDLADMTERFDWMSPSEGCADWWPLTIWCFNAEDMASRRRQLGGRWEKDADGSTFKLKGRVGAAHVVLCIARDAVCERVVVGTEVEMVPDPLAPKVEREVEIVEWICPESLLVGTEEEA